MRNVFYFSKKVRLFSQNDVLFLFYFLINPAGTTGSVSRGVSVQGDLCLGGSLSGRPPVRLCAGGTHPTVMHSCEQIIFKQQK